MPTTVYNKTETDDLLALKVDKVAGKQLSTEDFTTDEKIKLAGIEAGAEVNVNADWNATSGDAQILNKPSIPSKTSDLTNDSDFITASAVASGYVAKDGSKVLSDNNYDSASKTKLDNLVNITAIGDNLTLTNGTLSAGVNNPPGCVLSYAGAGTIPSGYLLCDGTSVSRTTYANLFAAIGTTYGDGDGSTTFKLPDLRGEFIRGLDGGRGIDENRTLGSYQKGSLLIADTKTIGLPVLRAASATTWEQGNAMFGYDNNAVASDYTGAQFTYATVLSSGNVFDTPTELAAGVSRPRNIAMNYIIKY